MRSCDNDDDEQPLRPERRIDEPRCLTLQLSGSPCTAFVAAAASSSSNTLATKRLQRSLVDSPIYMRPAPAAVAAFLIVSCVGFVAYSALPRERSGGVVLESAGDLIREAQHMKVILRRL
jgi:hypothetical protein